MNYIDKIVYINMDARADRREAIEKEFDRLGIKNQVSRFSALSYKDYPNAGCLLSHATVLEQAYDAGLSNVLVLEDDFRFIADANRIHSSMAAFFKLDMPWDVVMLTTCAAQISEPGALVSRILSSGNGAGYLVNRSMMLELSTLFKSNVENLYQTKRHWEYQNDMLWKQLMPESNWYMFNDYLGYQCEGYSDLSQDHKIAIIPHINGKTIGTVETIASTGAIEPIARCASPSIHFDIEEQLPSLESSLPSSVFSYTKDSIVNKVIGSFIERSNLGYKKYGTTLDRNDLSVLDWIQHAQEEHMDAILYLEKLKYELTTKPNA
jgi:hypothetical protein